MVYQKAILLDLDEIVVMKNKVKQRIINENLPIWKNGYPLDEQLLDDLKNGYGRIIKIDNKIVAYAAFMPSNIMYENESIFKKDNLYSFGRVMVIDEYLSKGIGRYLVSQMILEAKSLNADGLGITADECNVKATKLYKSFGFNKEGEKNFPYAYLEIYGLYF